MGYGIDIAQYDFHDTTAVKIRTVEESYLSYNWSDFKEVCLLHAKNDIVPTSMPIKDTCSRCEKTTLWYFRTDCHGLQGAEVSRRANRAIKMLVNVGVKITEPDPDNANWGWGLNVKNRAGVFAYHLQNLSKLGQRFPTCFFTGDGCDAKLQQENGREFTIVDKQEQNSDHLKTYYRHPLKGTLLVNTFKLAMEVFGCEMCIGNTDRADAWFDLAFKMHDAPKRM